MANHRRGAKPLPQPWQALLVLTAVWLVAPTTPSRAEPRPTPPAIAAGPLAPVSRVDLNRYAGLWHEIARIPNRFQRQCARDSLAV